MSCLSINRNFWHLIIGFCTILLYVSSCASAVREKSSVSPDILKLYVGNYQLAPSFIMMVTLEGNQLMTQATGQKKVPVYAKSETKFAPKNFRGRMEFIKNDKGEVTHLMLIQNGQLMKAPRIEKFEK